MTVQSVIAFAIKDDSPLPAIEVRTAGVDRFHVEYVWKADHQEIKSDRRHDLTVDQLVVYLYDHTPLALDTAEELAHAMQANADYKRCTERVQMRMRELVGRAAIDTSNALTIQ